MKPPLVRANDVIYFLKAFLQYESVKFTDLWSRFWSGDIQADQEMLNAVSNAHNSGDSPTNAAIFFAVSTTQVTTHNLSVALSSNPALTARPSVQQLLGALSAVRADEAISAEIISSPDRINDKVPYTYSLNTDGSVTLISVIEPEN